MESPHPSDQTLDAYRSGRLDRGAGEVVREHLEACPECWRRAASMSSASFLDWVGGAGKATTPPTTATALPETSKIVPGTPPLDTLPPGLADHRDYQIKKELGRGGMGVVYLAHNTLLGRDEVLKVMGRHIVERPGVIDRFHREMRAVARLRHPNIVSAYSAFRLGESIVFAMEYVEGLDLSKMVKAKGPLPVAHASMFVYQTALGLHHAHEEGLVHRDIKPGNLMLSRKGDKATIKILDFGLARATREEKTDSGLTADGQILGTPDFIAPEQILDAKSADIRADIYSLGATLYYLLIGRPPFISQSFHAICQAHISQTPDTLNLVRPEVPPELAAVVGRMMAKDPARRPQTPGEVAESLKPFFKKTGTADARPTAEISRVGAVFDKTQTDPDAAGAAVTAGKATEASVAESRWESLVKCQDEESPRDLVPAALAREWSPRKMWTTIVAASLLGLVALGTLVLLSTNRQPPPESRGGAVADAPANDDQGPWARLEKGAEKGPLESASDGTTSPGSARESTASTAPPHTVSAPADNQRLPSTAGTTSTSDGLVTAGHPLVAATRSVYVDDFNDATSGWENKETHGYSDGVFFVTPGKTWQNWRGPRRIQTESVVEVVGRLKSHEPITRGSWAVTISNTLGTGARRGFLVKVNGKGELFVLPHPSKEADAFRAVDPTIGPIVHPAIKPGDQWNALTLVMKKRTLEIMVNSVRVCGPLTLDYDLFPTFLLLGAFDGPAEFRAEFDRVEIREFPQEKPLVALVPDESIKLATHSVFCDDFHDSGSGWQRGGGKDYSSGIYFVDSGSGRSYWRAPRHIRMDGTLEVVGRMNGAGSTTKGSWSVIVRRLAGPVYRGFMVSINTKGQLFLRPSPDPSAKDFLKIEPTVGPIIHPAIKPGEQSNALMLVMKKRSLEIYVNSVRVYEPINFAFDFTPGHFSLGAWDDSGFRAEFEKVEIREFWDDKLRLSPTPYRSIASATRPFYFDDFNDPRSEWARGDRWNYSSGIYFVISRDRGKMNRCPTGLRTDSALEVVGRVKTAESSRRGSWGVVVNREIGGALRGFMVKINGKGELFLNSNPWYEARDFVDVDPTIGPIVGPAIRPANRVNRLVLLVRKRNLEIFVNSVRVCGPVPYDFDLTPSFVQLGAWDGPGEFRAEFDSISIRNFIRP